MLLLSASQAAAEQSPRVFGGSPATHQVQIQAVNLPSFGNFTQRLFLEALRSGVALELSARTQICCSIGHRWEALPKYKNQKLKKKSEILHKLMAEASSPTAKASFPLVTRVHFYSFVVLESTGSSSVTISSFAPPPPSSDMQCSFSITVMFSQVIFLAYP